MDGYGFPWLNEYDADLVAEMCFALISYKLEKDVLEIRRAPGGGRWMGFREGDLPETEAFRSFSAFEKDAFSGFLEPGTFEKLFSSVFSLLNGEGQSTFIPLALQISGPPERGMRILACRLKKKLRDFQGTDFRSACPVLFRLIAGYACREEISMPGKEKALRVLSDDYMSSFSIAACIFRDTGLPEINALMLVSAARYEGQSSLGAIAFLEEPSMEDESSGRNWIRFTDGCAVTVENARKLRKYLELSTPKTPLTAFQRQGLTENGEWVVYGLLGEGGEVKSRAVVSFTGILHWNVVFSGGEMLLFDGVSFHFRSGEEVRDGTKAGIERAGIFEKARTEALIRIVGLARQQKKGTLLIFTEAAEAEAERLGGSGRAIRVSPFDPDACRGQLMDLTGIDGAMLLDLDGICHAIGTLLDGEAVENSNRGRGARYNSAYTYIVNQKRRGVRCLGVVISEDGMTDFVS